MELSHNKPLPYHIVAIDPGISGSVAHSLVIVSMPTIKSITKPAVKVFARDSNNKKIIIKSGPDAGQFKQIIKTPAKYQTNIDTHKLNKLFSNSKITTLVIEATGRSFGNSAASSRTVNINYGKILALAEINNLTINIIQPSVWKRALSLSQDKQDSVTLAESLTNISFVTPRGKLLHDHAEAYLMGHYYDNSLK